MCKIFLKQFEVNLTEAAPFEKNLTDRKMFVNGL